MKKELIELRKSNQKHFLNEDGTIEALIYKNDIHYLKNGVYEEINNTLEERDNRYYVIGNDFDLSFSKKCDEQLLEFRKNNHYLKMKINGSNNVKNKELKKDSKIRKIGSISYNEIFSNIDLNYQIHPKKIKETIIFNDKECVREEFIFNIETDLELTVKNNKIVSNSDFYIEEPFMVDSNNNINNLIYYELLKKEYGYDIILKLDKTWLECSERVFPVYVDPTITVDYFDGFVDTYISSKYPTTNYGSDTKLRAGIFADNEKCMSLLKFDLPKIGTGSNVIDSRLYLYRYSNADDEGTYTTIMTAHKVTSDWDETTATWNDMYNNYSSRVEDYSDYAMLDYSSALYYRSFDITNLVKRWYAGEPNYGVLLKSHTDDYYETQILPEFFSMNNRITSVNVDPFISVTYRNQNGLESYMTYQTKKLSNGELYFNNHNGNMTMNLSLGGTIGNKNPISVNLFYNTNDVILENDYGYGIGNKLNFNQTLELVEIDSQNLYKYIDEDGTIHYFYSTSEDLSLFTDEDGLNLTLEIASDKIVMKDKVGNQKHFESYNGKFILTKIIDNGNNEINLTYSNGKIIKITNADSSEITISYGDNIVINSPSKTTTLTLSDNKLISVIDNFGETVIQYNSNNIISKIIDVSGMKVGFEYYNVIPYRIKKIINYGLNDSVGKTMEFTYGFETTNIINNKGKSFTYTFNEYGNTVSIVNFGENKNLNESYGKNNIYGTYEYYKNKLIYNLDLKRHVRNLIWNSSFEYDYNIFSTTGAIATITTETSYVNNRSLKITGIGNTVATINIDKNDSHTFSFYSKSTVAFDVVLTSGDISSIIKVNPSTEFIRNEVTINSADTSINISIITSEDGIIYLDAIQLEEGIVANPYNVIDNSDFKYNLAGWIYDNNNDDNHIFTPNEAIQFKTINGKSDEIVVFNNGTRALKVICDPTLDRSIVRKIPVKGEAGDKWIVSFWYKNNGLKILPNVPEFRNNTVQMCLFPSPTSDAATDSIFSYAELNTNCDEWQYYSTIISTEFEYDSLRLIIMSLGSANEYYLTNFSAYKINGLKINDYDSNGNIIYSMENNGNITSFKYDTNNQLINMTDPIGKDLSFEYDNEVSNRILSGISTTGISNSIKYDNNSNPVVTKIENKIKLNLETGIYYIRAKGTNKYLKIDSSSKNIILKSDTCSHAKWNVVVGENNTLVIEPLIINDVYIDNNVVSNLTFVFEKQDNMSFTIKNNDRYLTVNDNSLILSSIIDLDNQQFYFESPDNLYVESNAEYTSDGRFLTKTIDTLFNNTIYEVDTNKGLINKITDSMGNITNYTYNEKNQVSNMTRGSETVTYEYNNNNLLSKIIIGNKTYSFNYNDYLRISSIYLNDNKLIENIYEENNGNLLSSEYGNGNTVLYEYDEFDRIYKLTRMNDIFRYFYDNFGNIKKIESNEVDYKYYYDLAQRLINYQENDNYKLDYNYNEINNLVSKFITLGQNVNNYVYEYNEEDNIITLTNGNIMVGYTYDTLQRLVQININGYIINYQYVTNGKRTSTLVDSITQDNDTYKYKYDKLNNITKIYKNNELIKSYFYDINSELIKEIDNNGSIVYTYDNYGNILTKTSYDINDAVVNSSTYEYGNVNNKDQLTKYNDTIITYDAIGNPLAIGDSILTWTNGRQLNSYNNADLSATYKYNKDGIRIQKNINNNIYNYYLEGNAINYIQNGENVLYFIRDISDKLIGFKYNEDTYYYIKNMQEDIIGIKNTNLDTIAIYEYDSLGKILSITDENGSTITNDSHIAHINPFRYRSYYYDSETKLYYLNSRYYNPEWGRFINADNYLSTDTGILGYNMYTYCNNNYINYVDGSGNLWVLATLIGAIVTSAVVYNNYKQNKKAEEEIRAVQEKYPNSCINPIKSMEFDKTLKANAQKVKEDTKNMNIVEKNLYFLENADDDTIFDLKDTEEWKNQTIYYDGHVMEAQDLGNYHYGYITRAAGLSNFNLHAGSSVNQFTKMNSETLKNCFTTSLCDDPRDKYYIKLGAMAYDDSIR